MRVAERNPLAHLTFNRDRVTGLLVEDADHPPGANATGSSGSMLRSEHISIGLAITILLALGVMAVTS